MPTVRKINAIRAYLANANWALHPLTFRQMVANAVEYCDRYPRTTAAAAATHAIDMYKARAAGYLDGASGS